MNRVVESRKDGQDVVHMEETKEMRTEFLRENLKEIDHVEDLDVDGRITLQMFFKSKM
jgi:hypothetical protein